MNAFEWLFNNSVQLIGFLVNSLLTERFDRLSSISSIHYVITIVLII